MGTSDEDANFDYCSRLAERYRVTYQYPPASWKSENEEKKVSVRCAIYVSLDRVRSCSNPPTGGQRSRSCPQDWKVCGSRRSIGDRLYRSDVLLRGPGEGAGAGAEPMLILSKTYGPDDSPGGFARDWSRAWAARVVEVPLLKASMAEMVALVTTRRPFLRYYDFCDDLEDVEVRADLEEEEEEKEEEKEEEEEERKAKKRRRDEEDSPVAKQTKPVFKYLENLKKKDDDGWETVDLEI